LVDLVRPSVAKDIMFSARRLQSDEVLRIGLVNLVVDAEELEDVTVAYAQTLAANAPLSIRASKFYIDQLGLERSQSEEARMDAMQQESAFFLSWRASNCCVTFMRSLDMDFLNISNDEEDVFLGFAHNKHQIIRRLSALFG